MVINNQIFTSRREFIRNILHQFVKTTTKKFADAIKMALMVFGRMPVCRASSLSSSIFLNILSSDLVILISSVCFIVVTV